MANTDKNISVGTSLLLRKRWLLAASKVQQLTRESILPNHLQLSLFVPLPLPTPGSAPVYHAH